MAFPSPKLFRKKANWLTALGTEALSPALRMYAHARTRKPAPPREWRRVLITGANHIGDVLYRSASLERLKEGLPDCEFTYLAAPASAEVLQGNPALSQVLPWMQSDSPLELDAARVKALRGMKFDAIIGTNTAKYWPELLLGIRLGIGNRAAHVCKGFSGWVTHPLPLRYPQPFAAYFRDDVAALIGTDGDWTLRPRIFPDKEDCAVADALWEKCGLSAPVTAAFVTSRQPTGVWAPEKFGETLRLLRGKTQMVLLGAAGDADVLRRLNEQYQLDARIAAGALGIRALAHFLTRCAVVLTADSGPRHIANAAGVPVVFARNVWFDPVEAGVYVDTEHDLCPQPRDGMRGTALLNAIEPVRAAEVTARAGGYFGD